MKKTFRIFLSGKAISGPGNQSIFRFWKENCQPKKKKFFFYNETSLCRRRMVPVTVKSCHNWMRILSAKRFGEGFYHRFRFWNLLQMNRKKYLFHRKNWIIQYLNHLILYCLINKKSPVNPLFWRMFSFLTKKTWCSSEELETWIKLAMRADLNIGLPCGQAQRDCHTLIIDPRMTSNETYHAGLFFCER